MPVTNTGDDALVANCFLTGTTIATLDGERLVENLQIGDLVRTADGRDVPVKWMARQTIRPQAINMAVPNGRLPICISAGAPGHGLPHSSLYLTADHGMILDGYIVNAGENNTWKKPHP
ncbi:MAG: Hint domain-containing protein [Pseudoprimorskyibacter sp.]|nr:Hint domain-containing protein [Pseudoprimorskyibacter sp.]